MRLKLLNKKIFCLTWDCRTQVGAGLFFGNNSFFVHLAYRHYQDVASYSYYRKFQTRLHLHSTPWQAAFFGYAGAIGHVVEGKRKDAGTVFFAPTLSWQTLQVGIALVARRTFT